MAQGTSNSAEGLMSTVTRRAHLDFMRELKRRQEESADRGVTPPGVRCDRVQ